ncbi:MAG: leucine-rich repeat domain-containing protein [Bacteroidaceae bacterium]|nr:leucine-rich repeat domain-containing protein [Prevotella sp.]MBR1542831.1 leucine-rich repeat domain-containing protein [Bacteroidaceae bacterium]
MRKRICRLFSIGLVTACGLLTTSCSKESPNGDVDILSGDMMIVDVNGTKMFFLDNHDGTVSVTYDRRNPMHKTENNTYALTDYTGDIIVPSSISFSGNSYLVTGVTEAAFINNTQLTRLTLPSSVKVVGEMAFFGCSALLEVTLPEGLTAIPDYCFQNCKAMTTIHMPQHLNKIGKDAFKSCTKLERLTIPEGITDIPAGAFSGLSGLTKLTLPSSLKNIGPNAFSGCSRVTYIDIPSGVTELSDSVFFNCSGLLMVSLPESLTKLGSSTFGGCRSLVELDIPESVKEIGPLCFCSYNANGESNWKRLTLNIKSTTPPLLTGSIANQTDRKRIVVPRGYRDVYLETAYWNEFTQVMERNY